MTACCPAQVLGNVKGFFGAAVSIAIFRNSWTWSGLGGYLTAVAGLFWYMRERRVASSRDPTHAAGSSCSRSQPVNRSRLCWTSQSQQLCLQNSDQEFGQ